MICTIHFAVTVESVLSFSMTFLTTNLLGTNQQNQIYSISRSLYIISPSSFCIVYRLTVIPCRNFSELIWTLLKLIILGDFNVHNRLDPPKGIQNEDLQKYL